MTSASHSSSPLVQSQITSLIPSEPLFPESVPIEHTHHFNDTYCRDEFARPPAATQEAIWWTLEGQLELASREAEAQAEYEQSIPGYQLGVQQIDAKNDTISQHNGEVRLRHEAEVKVCEAEKQKLLDAYDFALSKSRSRNPDEMLETLCRRCEAALEASTAHIIAYLQAIYIEARREFFEDNRSTFPWHDAVGLYLLLLFVWPLLTPIAGVSVFLCWRAMQRRLAKRLEEKLSEQSLALFFRDNWVEKNAGQYDAERIPLPLKIMKHNDQDQSDGGWKHRGLLWTGDDLQFNLQAGYFPHLSFWLSFLPGVSLFTVLQSIRWSRTLNTDDSQKLAERIIAQLVPRVRSLIQVSGRCGKRREVLVGTPQPPALPSPPCAPSYRPSLPSPTQPQFREPAIPQWPGQPDVPNQSPDKPIVIRGSTGLNSLADNRLFGRHAVFAGGRVQPYFPFGGVPTIFYPYEPINILFIGMTSSGKTKHLDLTLSYVLPLSKRHVQTILRTKRENRTPASFSQWSRSLTHQAIVYNAKDANVTVLAQLGFDPDVDLHILDPADRRVRAPNFAKDISDSQSASQFADSLIPGPPQEHRREENEVWLDNSRELVGLVIHSFINAARAKGKKPNWNLQDLINAFDTEEKTKAVLKYCDKPEAELEHFFGYSGPQKHSIFLSVRTKVRRFKDAAAQYKEAERLGRTISLKDWLVNGSHSVLVLPNTLRNQSVYEPLNQLLYLLLTKWILDDAYSKYIDSEGVERTRRRFFVVDEMGNAGRIPQWERLMSEGRTYGVNVIAGVQQLSMLLKTYGQNDTHTILGQFSYRGFLRTSDPETQKYMAEIIGKQILLYDLLSFQCGVTVTESKTSSQQETDTSSKTVSQANMEGDSVSGGETHTRSQSEGSSRSGPSYTASKQNSISYARMSNNSHSSQHTDSVASQQGHSSGHSEGTTNSVAANQSEGRRQHLQDQYAVHPHTFAILPHTGMTGLIGGIFITPWGQMWRADLEFETFSPEFVCPDAKNTVKNFLPWPDEPRVTKQVSWTEADYERLDVRPPKPKRKRKSKVSSDEAVVPTATEPILLPHTNPQRIGAVLGDFQFEET